MTAEVFNAKIYEHPHPRRELLSARVVNEALPTLERVFR
jgi:hypothetical protein